MIVEKNKTQQNTGESVSGATEITQVNPMTQAYNAVREILETIKEDPNDPDSPQYFKTIKIDNGQLSRIKNNKWNKEYSIAFPAIFIHFIDVNFLVGQSNIAEGKGVMRIHYVLNRLNNSDDVVETEIFEMFSRINAAIQGQKMKYPALSRRFQLAYWDQPLSFDDGLQQLWIDYDIWFTDYTAQSDRNYVETHIVIPPFTDHSDQEEENRNGHEDHKDPTFDEQSGFVIPE